MKEFERFYCNNYKKVLYYLSNLTSTRELAEDLAQDAFYRAYVFLCAHNGTVLSLSWILKIAHHLFIDHVRKNKIELRSSCIIDDSLPQQDTDITGRLQLLSILKALPERYRALILLKDYYGFSYNEMADITDCSPGAIKITLHRARKKFKEVFDQYEKAGMY